MSAFWMRTTGMATLRGSMVPTQVEVSRGVNTM